MDDKTVKPGELEKHIEQAEAGKNIIGQEYSWELDYNKSWQHVTTTEEGVLTANSGAANRLRYTSKPEKNQDGLYDSGDVARCCILRNIVLIIDCSKGCLQTDYKPYRLNVFISKIDAAFTSLVALTPLASVALVATYNMKAHLIQGFTSDAEELKSALKSLLQNEVHVSEGHMSLYLAVGMALDLLETHTVHGSKEVFMCIMSNATIDERPIDELLPKAKDINVVVTSISLTPEIFAVKNFCEGTGGMAMVILDTAHLVKALDMIKKLPKWSKQINPYLIQCALVEMYHLTTISMCMCHEYAILKSVTCPRCGAIHCQTAIKCVLCGLLLLQDFDVQRLTLTYNVLPKFDAVLFQNRQECGMCLTTMGDTDPGNRCNSCNDIYCQACFSLMEKQLQFCPNCAKKTIINNRSKNRDG